ncbi:hypothetical protein FMUND_9460 [Fusarium mundagurra]|uniref:C2H2-type domain-containing protein n=1 Tax=Fusarium mundagurra TaxID=1567541 RepID=A0A8H5YFB0_9HYPO|nr:hypothetical protein FMUND_9460 [Fusarium mundagurra]
MNVGQGDASKLKSLAHSNETSHGGVATEGAAKDMELANNAIPASYVLKQQSEEKKPQQSHKISGTTDGAKGARDHHEQVLDPQKDACRAQWKYSENIEKVESNPALLPKEKGHEQPSEEGYQKELACSGDKVTDKSLNLKRRAEDTKTSHKRSRTSTATDTNKRVETFACPYYRKDPERHLDCINLKMIRISDVKQHLKRRHTFNQLCTRCFEGFSSSEEYEGHILQQSCPIVECNNDYSVSPTAQEALKYRVDRSSSSEVQWHEMSKILFGKLGLSLNPYQDGVFKEITGIIRGIWKNEGQNIVSSLGETQSVPCADQLRPLWSEILTRVEDCFEQKEQKSSKVNPRERSESNQSTPRMSPEEGKLNHDGKPSSGLSTIENDCEPLEVNGPHNFPMQDWSHTSGPDPSNNIFNYNMLPEYQNHQIGCPFMNLSSDLFIPDEGRNWQFMSPSYSTAMDNIMAHQTFMGDFQFTGDDLLSTQMPNMYG